MHGVRNAGRGGKGQAERPFGHGGRAENRREQARVDWTETISGGGHSKFLAVVVTLLVGVKLTMMLVVITPPELLIKVIVVAGLAAKDEDVCQSDVASVG